MGCCLFPETDFKKLNLSLVFSPHFTTGSLNTFLLNAAMSFSLQEKATWEASPDHKSFPDPFWSKRIDQIDENEYAYYGKM